MDFEAALRAITQDVRYLDALDWGQRRPGHPEGTVRAHIAELEKNLKRLARKLSEDFEQLIGSIRDWNVFLAFQIIDGCTDGKDRAPLKWLFRQVEGKVESDFGVADLL